ncbi:MAG TPA: YebC/PmpR family DNA-binding transcriptional regulator [Phycisphaerae bacterium]|nr:YebC/PmpR family DNA-binding transcriptional regulator [Phycisphaerae bacterium]
MSGHSHWAKVKRSKASTDARRGRLWGKLARRIIVAAKTGGGSPDENLTLRYAIDDARAANMPNDTIDRAIKKGTGELGGESYDTVVYEGYGPGGVAFLVEGLTDNRNRTASEVRHIFDRNSGQMGSANSVAWMFTSKGTFVVAADAVDEDTLMEIALDAGAQDIRQEGDLFEVLCEAADFARLKQSLADREIATVSAEIAMVPANRVAVEGDNARRIVAIMEALEDHDDVQNVYSNFDIPEEILAQAGGS